MQFQTPWSVRTIPDLTTADTARMMTYRLLVPGAAATTTTADATKTAATGSTTAEATKEAMTVVTTAATTTEGTRMGAYILSSAPSSVFDSPGRVSKLRLGW